MVLAEATTAGCISADPELPPTAAIIVSSSGKRPCIPSDMRVTAPLHSAMWSVRSWVRKTHTHSRHTTRPASPDFPVSRVSRAQTNAGAISRVSRHRLPFRAERNWAVSSAITWVKSRESSPLARANSVAVKPPVAAKGSPWVRAASRAAVSRAETICPTPSLRDSAAAVAGSRKSAIRQRATGFATAAYA